MRLYIKGVHQKAVMKFTRIEKGVYKIERFVDDQLKETSTVYFKVTDENGKEDKEHLHDLIQMFSAYFNCEKAGEHIIYMGSLAD